MRIFIMGAIAAVLFGALFLALGQNEGQAVMTAQAAFVCGAVSQAIKQLKE